MPAHIKEIANELAHLQKPVEFDGKFALHPEERLPELQSPGTLAIGASIIKNPGKSLFALICQKEAAPRHAVIRLMSRVASSIMLVPIGSGTVIFPEDNIRRFVIIFERPPGRKLVPQAGFSVPKMDQEAIIAGVIIHLLPAFRELSTKTLMHRAIRPDNIYFSSDGRATLGECLSTPAAYAQPVLYEPIDSGLANPSGRGDGEFIDDLYSFGVLLAELSMGGTLLNDKSDEEIIEAKIRLGSYGALLGQSRVPLKLMEPLRGLLSDDPYERWNMMDLDMWANGRQLSPKQVPLPPKAVRTIPFAGQSFFTSPLLANAMRLNWEESKHLVASDNLDSWVRRALANEEMGDLLAYGKRTANALSSTGSGEDRAVSTTIMALDPTAPIVYRDVCVRVEAVAQAIALEFFEANKAEQFLEIIRMKLSHVWVSSQTRTKPEFITLIKQIEHLAQNVKNMVPGYGLERTIYSGNDGWPCQSPLVGDNYVNELKHLLPAIEAMIASGRIEGAPVDRHILAFAMNLMRGNFDALLKRFEDPFKKDVYNAASLRFLADLQKQFGPAELPALSAHMSELLVDSVESFHNTTFRRQLRDAVGNAKQEGKLTTLQTILDNSQIQDQDKAGFDQAQAIFANLEAQATWLENGGLVSDQNVRSVSAKSSAVISGVCSGFALVFMTIFWVL